jgi:hypothetical protein
MNVTDYPDLQEVDVFTIAGVYKHRTLWQRITRRPRELQRFIFNHSGALEQLVAAQWRMNAKCAIEPLTPKFQAPRIAP